jgi:hypothetical protein
MRHWNALVHLAHNLVAMRLIVLMTSPSCQKAYHASPRGFGCKPSFGLVSVQTTRRQTTRLPFVKMRMRTRHISKMLRNGFIEEAQSRWREVDAIDFSVVTVPHALSVSDAQVMTPQIMACPPYCYDRRAWLNEHSSSRSLETCS